MNDQNISKNDPSLAREKENPRKLSFHEFDRWGDGNFQLHSVGYLPHGLRWHYDRLCNPFWRFYYNTEPGAYLEVDGQQHPLLPDQVLIVPENLPFNSRNGIGIPHLWLHFSPPFAARYSPVLFTAPIDDVLRSLIRQLQEYMLGARRTHVTRHRLFHGALSLIHACFGQNSLKMEPPLPAHLGRILENIERSLSSPPPNGVMAQQAGMSVEGFGRWFKRHLGLSPARYVARRRIREACRLLSLTDGSIESVTEAVGFANRHHFSRVFRQHTGCAPAQFRRQQTGTCPDLLSA